MTDVDTTALVRRAVEEIWNRGELNLAGTLFSADYINHDGLIPDLVRGPEAIKLGVTFYRTAFPDLHITIDALTAQHDAVVLHWTARSSSGQGTLAGTLVCRVANAQIAESWMQWDRAGVLERVGLGSATPNGVPIRSG